MDSDVDVTEKAGFGFYFYYAAAAITTMAALGIILGFGLYFCCAAAVTTIISLATIADAKKHQKSITKRKLLFPLFCVF